MIQSTLVGKRFHKSHQHYESHAQIQKKLVHDLLLLCQKSRLPKHYDCALEIGCGTGYLTKHFLKEYAVDTLYLNDLYDDIKTNPIGDCLVYYLIDDIQNVKLTSGCFDLVFSGSALQWIYPLDNLLSCVHRSLKKDGYLVFSSYLSDNLWQIKKLTHQGLHYYSFDELRRLLFLSGFELLSYEQQYDELLFDGAYDVLRHLKKTGVTANRDGFVWNKQTLKQFDDDYQALAITKNNKNHYPLTYHSVLVVAKRRAL